MVSKSNFKEMNCMVVPIFHSFLGIFILTLLLAFAVPAFAQEVFNSQNALEIYLNGHDNTLFDWRVGVDYVFSMNNFYEIEGPVFVRDLWIENNQGDEDENGVQIEFTDPDAKLRVTGTLFVNTDNQGNPDNSYDRACFFAQEVNGTRAWGGIEVFYTFPGDQVVFYNADILGGGDYSQHGQFKVGAIVPNEIGFRNVPGYLTVINCNIEAGRGPGICFAGAGVVVVDNTEIHDMEVREEEDDFIDGILVLGYPLLPAHPCFLSVQNNSEIYNCRYGIYSYTLNGGFVPPPAFGMQLDASAIFDNNDTGIRVEARENSGFGISCTVTGGSTIHDNGGWGINITEITNGNEFADRPYVGPTSFLTVSDGCEVFENTLGGIRARDVNMGINILESDIYDNGIGVDDQQEVGEGVIESFARGQGIKVRLWRQDDLAEYQVGEGVQSFLNVVDCEIFGNGFEGIAVSKGEDAPQPINAPNVGFLFYNDHINIVGNHIYDNGANCEDFEEPARDVRRGANIHILERLHHVSVSHNLIEGGLSGICWDVTDVFVNEVLQAGERPSHNIIVRNNVITDAFYGFLALQEYSPDPLNPMDFDDGVFPSLMVNNVLWDNGKAPAPVLLTPANAYFAATTNVYSPIQFESNLVGFSDDYNGNPATIGVYYHDGVWPSFDYNAFAISDQDRIVVDITGWLGPNEYPNSVVAPDADGLGLVNVSDAGVSDFHLKWNSPLINLGRDDPDNDDPTSILFEDWDYVANSLTDADYVRPDNEDVKRDGTRNDAGLFGDEWADGIKFEQVSIPWGGGQLVDTGDPYFDFWTINVTNDPPQLVYLGPPEDDYGFDPYCRIDAGYADLCTDELHYRFGEESLQADYYRAFADYRVPMGEELEIDAGAYFENRNQVDFNVKALLTVNGEEDNPVTFSNYPGETWEQIKFTSSASVFSEIHNANINGAVTGLYFSLVPNDLQNPEQRIELENLVVEDCECYGIYIYDSRILISGEHPTMDDADEFRNRIRSIKADAPVLQAGMLVSNCGMINAQAEEDEWDVMIQDTYVGQCVDARMGDFFNGGLTFTYTDARIKNVTAHENGVTGMAVIWCGDGLNGDGSAQYPSIDLRNNGLNLAQANANGAEVYIDGYPMPSLEAMDVVDPFGKLIYRTNQTLLLNVANSWWGEALDEADPLFQEWVTNRLFPDFLVSYNFTPIANGANDVDSDEFSFADARYCLNHGQPRTALEIMETLIREDHESNDGQNSARYIHLCYRALNMPLDSLFAFYRTTAEQFNDCDIATICRLKVPQVLTEEKRIEDALMAYLDLMNDPRNEAESLLAQIGYLELSQAVDEDEIDSNPLNRQVEMRKLLSQLTANSTSALKTALPTEYSLSTPYPNPFNSTTTIGYSLPVAGMVNIEVFDLSGRRIETVYSGETQAGVHTTVWNGDNKSAGLYFIRLQAGNRLLATKALLVK